jgi:hypothetical protein
MTRTLGGMAPARPLLYLVAVLGGAGMVAAVLGALRLGDDLVGALIWSAMLPPGYVTAVWLMIRRPDHVQTWRLLLVGAGLYVAQGVGGPLRQLLRVAGDGGWFVSAWTADQVLMELCGLASAVLIASYPDGVVERRWQRVVVRALWRGLAPPVVHPDLVPDGYVLTYDHPPVASGVFVPALAWLGPAVLVILKNYLIILIGIAVAVIRFAQAPALQRARMRLLIYSVAATAALLCVDLAVRARSGPGSGTVQVLDLISSLGLLMIPFSVVVGVVRHRLF